MAKFCPSCGSPLKEGAKFCMECGERIEAVPATPAQAPTVPEPVPIPTPVPVPPPAPTPAPIPAPPVQRVCQRCGCEMDDDAIFCEVCGASADGRSMPQLPAGAQPVYRGAPMPAAQPARRSGPPIVLLLFVIAAAVGAVFSVKYLLESVQMLRSKGEQFVGEISDTGSAVSGLPDFAEPEAPAVQIPEGAVLNTGAAAGDILGDWTGTFTFTEMRGMENIEGAPDNILEIEAQALETPVNYTLTFDADGGWRCDIDFMNGMSMSDTDLRAEDPQTPQEASAHLYQGPKDGYVTIRPADVRDTQEDAKGSMQMVTAVCSDAEGTLLAGTMEMVMRMDGAEVRLAGTYTVRPAASSGGDA